MINLDGSHEAWLIYSDWLEDQDDELCHQIRSDLEDDIENWTIEYQYRFNTKGVVGDGVSRIGSFGGICSVGGCGVVGKRVGGDSDSHSGDVGDNYND
jgi:hypothetical protein